MIYWRNLNADDLSKRELRLALEDAIAEIERATQKRSNDVYFSAFEDELDRAPDYQRVDLRATWTSASEAWATATLIMVERLGLRTASTSRNRPAYVRPALRRNQRSR